MPFNDPIRVILYLVLGAGVSLGCAGRPIPWEPEQGSDYSPWPMATSLPLGESKWDFARYLNSVHIRIHPIFADQFLPSLESLPTGDPRNGPVTAEVAVIVEGRNGKLEDAVVVRSSDIPAFDAAARDSVVRAFPSDPPPASCWSSDGSVYFTWEFHRGPEACGTWNARPFKLSF